MKQATRPGSLTRREFHRVGAAIAASVAAGPFVALGARAAEDGANALVDTFPENEALVNAIQYVNVSEREGQHCSNCALYTAAGDGRGKCGLFQKGLVTETGWCTSWIQKPSA